MSNKVAATWHPGTAPDSTPIDRAAEALAAPIPDINRLSHVEIQRHLAHAALSAALTNDADPDWLAKLAAVAWGRQWDVLGEDARNHYRSNSAALLALILGEA